VHDSRTLHASGPNQGSDARIGIARVRLGASRPAAASGGAAETAA